MPIIQAHQLTKHYGKVKALDGIDLEVREGEVFGFIGPNGAGKSTTIRILLGLLRKTQGEISLFGGDPWHDAVALHPRLAYVPSDVSLWPNLTGGEVIDLMAKLRGSINSRRRAELIERFAFDPSKRCRTYSKGNRQKVAIISALVSEVDLFILDEPTTGLDPLMEAVFQECVRELKKEGKTIFLSSHILAEVEKLCDRVSIIKDGKIIEAGTLAELRHFTRTAFVVETEKQVDGLSHIDGVYQVENDGVRIHFNADASALSRIMAFLAPFGVRAITCSPPTLEELFLRHYSQK
ncbi:ABC transporter ATP-binding protein [Paenibacillus aestuarii]|uniref:ABC transporter ATP-binding protein n=1 Tax=Paenibacillus aestuarii TaxID=516965 RepID=A0ABW0K2Q5_9BACL|nr:ABC transporter ATP-binding protein [Paenibacillus aestuarii]